MITIPKNGSEEIRITREFFKGHDLISVRVWFEGQDGEMRPGKQGLAFRRHLLPEVLAALQSEGND